MRTIVVLVLGGLLTACATPKPVAVQQGEACWRCRQPINNVRLAGEVLASNGLASKFRTVHCMSTWIGKQRTVDGSIYVTDYASGTWIPAAEAYYVRTIVDTNTMAHDFLAFAHREMAVDAAQKERSRVETWNDVLELGRSAPIGG